MLGQVGRQLAGQLLRPTLPRGHEKHASKTVQRRADVLDCLQDRGIGLLLARAEIGQELAPHLHRGLHEAKQQADIAALPGLLLQQGLADRHALQHLHQGEADVDEITIVSRPVLTGRDHVGARPPQDAGVPRRIGRDFLAHQFEELAGRLLGELVHHLEQFIERRRAEQVVEQFAVVMPKPIQDLAQAQGRRRRRRLDREVGGRARRRLLIGGQPIRRRSDVEAIRLERRRLRGGNLRRAAETERFGGLHQQGKRVGTGRRRDRALDALEDRRRVPARHRPGGQAWRLQHHTAPDRNRRRKACPGARKCPAQRPRQGRLHARLGEQRRLRRAAQLDRESEPRRLRVLGPGVHGPA